MAAVVACGQRDDVLLFLAWRLITTYKYGIKLSTKRNEYAGGRAFIYIFCDALKTRQRNYSMRYFKFGMI